MKKIIVLFSIVLIVTTAPLRAETARGKLTGGISYSVPEWFKTSFLHFADDVAEAKAAGKHVMVFFRLTECPYCARMLQESFRKGPEKEYIQKHFDVVSVDVRGGGETVWIDGNKKVLQLTGYRDPRALRQALEYVRTKSYNTQTFAQFLAQQTKPAIYKFRNHPLFTEQTSFKNYQKPLAILFEDEQCGECDRFHDKTLNHPEVMAEMKPFLFVRLDANSNQPITDIDGNTVTAAQWMKKLGLTYRPSLALFNEGRVINIIDGRLYHFHFKERLRYVSGGYYELYLTAGGYNAMRRDELLKKGININYGED